MMHMLRAACKGKQVVYLLHTEAEEVAASL
jgi:hypothetical protein